MDLTAIAVISTVAVLILSVLIWRVKKAYGFFAKQSIPGPNPAFPLGTWNKSARTSIGFEDKQLINKYGPFVGTFDGLTANLLIGDLESVKKILKTDAGKFKSQRAESSKNKILKNVLEVLYNDNQNESSSILNAPINRRKLTKLFPRVDATANELIRNLVKSRQENVLLVNDAINDFAHDATALLLLGVDLNADPIYRQTFIRNCENLFPGFDQTSAIALIPYLYGSLDNAIASKTTIEYFSMLIENELKKRGDENYASKSVDFVDLLLEISKDEEKIAKKENNAENVEESLILNDEILRNQILAAVFTFNYWMRNTLLFAIQALSINQEVQEKLFEEVKKTLQTEKLGGELLEKLPYLNGFVKEVQRMYPAEARLEKIATEEISLSTFKISKGDKITIPVYALHTSKEYHDEPKTLNPDRYLNAEYEKDNPLILTPSNAALSTALANMILKTSILKIVAKFKFAEKGEIEETGAAFVTQPAAIQVQVEIRE